MGMMALLLEDLEDINVEVEKFLEFDVAHKLVVSNSLFTKRESHLVTYQSGENRSQIDYWCENNPTERATQHKRLVCQLTIKTGVKNVYQNGVYGSCSKLHRISHLSRCKWQYIERDHHGWKVVLVPWFIYSQSLKFYVNRNSVVLKQLVTCISGFSAESRFFSENCFLNTQTVFKHELLSSKLKFNIFLFDSLILFKYVYGVVYIKFPFNKQFWLFYKNLKNRPAMWSGSGTDTILEKYERHSWFPDVVATEGTADLPKKNLNFVNIENFLKFRAS